ncbi:DUF1971 domain-containing protein [Actinospongicola halichondriae]|uniref:DUF1971 domain-containing protein n=1 Tax=Actinospongicola halichondriae TaxID=3236844 RepID=UPI003D59C300
MERTLPPGSEYVRTTPTFDNESVPAGLLRDHRVAAGVWGRLVVHDGTLRLVFAAVDDQPAEEQVVDVDHPGIIPPERPHQVMFDGPVTFAVEFHREAH